MSKFEVGDTVKISGGECSLNGDECVVTKVEDDIVYYQSTESGEACYTKPGTEYEPDHIITLIRKKVMTFKDLQEGDKFYSDYGDTYTVQGRINDNVVVALTDDEEYNEAALFNYREFDNGTYHINNEEDVIELTLADVAELKGVDVDKIRIKD